MKKEAEARYQTSATCQGIALQTVRHIHPGRGPDPGSSPEKVEEAKKAIGEGAITRPRTRPPASSTSPRPWRTATPASSTSSKTPSKKALPPVKEQLGGNLPDITEQTYDLVQQKFADWAKELGIDA
jgi:hypothetical protein